ncbi:MAG: hypothetical protein CMP91_00900 [Gammaproteobacteria bacterium]|nr:hypothetical protein [Gammaproteobacteria bacterium]|tara:strand:- start:108 stop:509 length:402 start_codon:yes stop_codon:yes gene_type:complete
MPSRFISIFALLSVFLSSATFAQEQVAPGVWLSRNGEYRVSVSPLTSTTPDPWTLYIRTATRAPVSDAIIEVHGYHPETRTILPNMPIITPHLGRGEYEVYNIYFDEPGQWEVNIVITSGSTIDAVLLPIDIP